MGSQGGGGTTVGMVQARDGGGLAWPSGFLSPPLGTVNVLSHLIFVIKKPMGEVSLDPFSRQGGTQ